METRNRYIPSGDPLPQVQERTRKEGGTLCYTLTIFMAERPTLRSGTRRQSDSSGSADYVLGYPLSGAGGSRYGYSSETGGFVLRRDSSDAGGYVLRYNSGRNSEAGDYGLSYASRWGSCARHCHILLIINHSLSSGGRPKGNEWGSQSQQQAFV